MRKTGFIINGKNEDYLAYNNNKIGKNILFSCIGNNTIGYFSWDNRQFPNGIVGQNRILPNYRGRGYGTRQIEKTIEIFKIKNFKTLTVKT